MKKIIVVVNSTDKLFLLFLFLHYLHDDYKVLISFQQIYEFEFSQQKKKLFIHVYRKHYIFPTECRQVENRNIKNKMICLFC